MSEIGDLPLDILRAVLAIAEGGGLTAAATILEVHPSRLSRRLGMLQSGIAQGKPLLRRDGRRLTLTEEGQAVLPTIRDLLRQHDQLADRLSGRGSAFTLIRVGVGAHAAEHLLPGALALLRKKTPGWRAEIVLARGAERILGTLEGRFDLSVVTHDPLQIDSLSGSRKDLVIEPLAGLPLCVVAKKGTPQGKALESVPERSPASLHRLSQWPFVGLDAKSGIRRILERKSPNGAAGLRFDHEIDGGGWPAAREYARHGLGLAVIPLATLRPDDSRDLVARRVSDAKAIEQRMIFRKDAGNPSLEALKAALRKAAAGRDRETARRNP